MPFAPHTSDSVRVGKLDPTGSSAFREDGPTSTSRKASASGSVRIIAGTASLRAASALAAEIGAPLVSRESRTFPDGEIYVRLAETVRGDDVIIVQATLPNEKLVELLLLQDAAHSAGARSITVAIPYFAYSRQDQLFKEGESVSAHAIAELVEEKADRVVLVDPHKEHILGFFGVPAAADSAVPELAARLRAEGVDLVLAPDKGAFDRARAAAKILGVACDHLEKTRIDANTVRVAPKSLATEGRTVAILDDIISTGGTIAVAAGELKAQGAKRVVACATHGLFLGDARDRLAKAGCDAVFSADTIEGPLATVSCAPAIARALRKVKAI